ncbi:hypothetical protein AGMMS4956_12350 [Bacteroidia bacterium]|nr:hypothetical protein AGMMS4956_12350 [Bacteroidia bacterium]
MAASCKTVFQYPDEDMTDTRMDVKTRITVNLTELKMTNHPSVGASNTDKDIRFVIDFIPISPTGAVAGERAAQIVAAQPCTGVAVYQLQEIQVKLAPARYTLLVWADFVDRGTLADKYYDTHDLQTVNIIPTAVAAGYNVQKDAHAGKGILNIAHFAGQNSVPTQTVIVALIRPFAHYQVVATDVQTYISFAARNGEPPPPLSPLTVKCDYGLTHLPSQYNVSTAQVGNYVQMGTYQRSNIALPAADTTLLLAEDYVLVQNTNNIYATFTIYRPTTGGTSTFVHNIIDLEQDHKPIQLKRNQLTIVKGKFLTQDINQGGVGIDDRFKGDTVIYLPNWP